MTRGNQREIDRQRALNRHAGKGEARDGNPLARREADAKALADKIARKKAATVEGSPLPVAAPAPASGNNVD